MPRTRKRTRAGAVTANIGAPQIEEAAHDPGVSLPAQEPEPEPEAVEIPVQLLELRDGLPEVCATPERLLAGAKALAGGAGPIAIDAERASGYRYSSRAYLIQLRREGAGILLVDPVAFDDLEPLVEVLNGTEWILHAASQDLACLAEVGLRPTALFDTELAGRLLGYPRVGLATLVEEVLGFRLRKEHSAVDWSTRPLPQPWLQYAALDVEPLVELREALLDQLHREEKWEWARQEFEYLIASPPHHTRAEPWRRTSGLHKVRGRRALAAVRSMWLARDEIAAERDVTPGRILPDSAIVAVATEAPADRNALMAIPGFRGRGAQRYAPAWLDALQAARSLADADLPSAQPVLHGPPPPRVWADKNPAAHARLTFARTKLAEISEERNVPVENMLTPDFVRRILWAPPTDLTGALTALGARPWQIGIVGDVLGEALDTHPDA